ncbi:NADH-quinone oxidoreductase subunit K [Thiocapsa bogorovii]|uniref:NADH-quinone oxidoreductase subunit K n=1 Tax=Thiocapsa bogorovii TaxID=521689 RepID=UPI001E38EA74|nr:NADH-quinone oxidoreductase subunit K [Thiocapsa bogorovii]UHD17535.1 NADH-quinone oxidoreductase subunit K [Thiocapsa bogorovii]
MNGTTLFGLGAAALVGLGLYGLICQPGALRKILAFNLIGSGIFLLFGVIAKRGGGALAAAGSGSDGDPVPQALVITGLVVAFAGTAIAVALLVRLAETAGRSTLDTDAQDASSLPADANPPGERLP